MRPTSILVVLLSLLLGSSALAAPETRPITFTVDGKVYEGALVVDKAKAKKGKLPGVLVVHQYMGPGENEIMRAKMLADLGYAAFVVDVYGQGVRPKSPADAMAASKALKDNRPELRKRLAANLEQLVAQNEVDASNVAAIGYCFGGTAVIELARAGAALKGVVSFHGGLDSPTPADGKNITAKVLVLHGAADPHVKAPDIQAFIAELDAAKVDWQMTSYAGAVHAFTQKEAGNDPSKGAAYDAKADARSWVAMRDFLVEVLGK